MDEFTRSEYRLPDKVRVLELDDVGFPGGEVRVSVRLPLGLFEELGNSRKADLAKLRPIFVKWGLRGWNLVDHQGPLPPDEDGMKRLEPSEQMAVIAAWLRGVVEPPAPLSPPSSDTEPSPAQKAPPSPRRSPGRRSRTTSSSGTPATP